MVFPSDAAPSAPPDWENVPFAVCCARCGHDVHGQSEPLCSECDFVFDWADAVPVEKLTCRHCDYHLYGLRSTRCPECGESFTWDDALLHYRANQKPYFEYRWRDAPIRSFVGTWLRSLCPGRFWRSMDIHDPPQTRSLFVMVLLGLGIILLQLAILHGVTEWFWNVRAQRTASGWVLQSPKLADLPLNLLNSAGDPNTYVLVRMLLPWLIVNCFSLFLFPQSMRRARLRLVHIVRVWAYSLLPTVPLALAAVFLYRAVYALGRLWYPVNVDAICVFVVLGYVIWSIRCACRFYLRMPHALGIALASQLVAILGGGLLESLFIQNISDTFLYKGFDLLGLF